MIFDYSMFDMLDVNNDKLIMFEQKIQRDFDMIKDYLPRVTNDILDIGCGMGGIDILISRNKKVGVIHLLDGEGTSRKKAGFHKEMEPWFDVSIAMKFVEKNVLSKCTIHKLDESIRVDLIISLKSWGHHYPISRYVELAKKSLRPSGRIILDIRKNVGNGRNKMENSGFKWLRDIYETPKCTRMVFCHA